jgi:transposase-like protein
VRLAVWQTEGSPITTLPSDNPSRSVRCSKRRFPQAVALLQAGVDEVLTYMRFPSEHWQQTHPTNPPGRCNREPARRCDVVGIFPHVAAVLRLVGALPEEVQHEWLVARR